MNAIEVEKKIRDKFSYIVDTIVFFCGENNRELIEERCSNLNLFVYDDNVLHSDRIAVIDRLEVAMEFARDISLDLDVDEDRRFEIEHRLGAIIIEAAKHDNSEEIIRNAIDKIAELDSTYVEEVLRLVDYYKNDYQIKNIDEIVSKSEYQFEAFQKRIYSIKRELLEKRFGINGEVNVEKLWNLLDSFLHDLEMLNSSEFKNIIDALQKEFYIELGCKGNSIEELTNDALEKGIIMSSYIRGEIMKEYLEEYYHAYDAIMGNTNNLQRIMKELDKKGYIYDKNYLRLGVSTPNRTAINFLCLDKYFNRTSFVVYSNNAQLYSTEFDARCFHEIVHYLGGLNTSENKRGLKFNDMEVYDVLEESYTHYISIMMAKEYNKHNGCILQPWYASKNQSLYNSTLEYMKEVFKIYGKELIAIHLSDSITLKEANQLIPFDDIAYSVSRIFNDKDSNRASKEEINKLIRSIKK